MIIKDYLNEFITPIRQISGKVELYSSTDAIEGELAYNDKLKSIKIDRVSEHNKFFGFGVSQKATIEILDKERAVEPDVNGFFDVLFNINEHEYVKAHPHFYIEDIARDEKTNSLKLVGHDALFAATAHKVNELGLVPPYTIRDFIAACASVLGVGLVELTDGSFSLSYPIGANFDGDESLRDALNDAAEATQTIYFINKDNELVFKRLSISNVDYFIDKSIYFDLKTKPLRTLGAICSATELGDNLTASLDIEGGLTQYIKDNAFIDLREDRAEILDGAIQSIGGFNFTPFDLEWRGNYLLEIGDMIGLTTKDNDTVFSYLLNDTLTYNGGLKQSSSLSYEDNKAETASNSTNLGEHLKKTFAKVDKVNQEITMMASDVSTNKSQVSQLLLDTNTINLEVSRIEKEAKEAVEGLNDDMAEVKNKTNLMLDENKVKIIVSQEKANSASKIETDKGFTFDNNGLTITASDSPLSTNIDEDGMTINKGSQEMLVANNQGVKARDLHAETYLIIGSRSRFEDYGSARTGCFWIGG